MMMEAAQLRKVLPERPLQILLIEDNPAEVELCFKELIKANLDFHCDPVSTLVEFEEKLSVHDYDVILADYQLAGWTSMDALALLKTRGKDVPFVLVTGTLGEEKAVECLEYGVDEYILKDRLARLPLATFRALEKKFAREQHRRAHDALRENEERFRALTEATASPILIYQGTECRYANRAAEEITGYTREELLVKSSWDIIHPDSRNDLIEQGFARLQGTRGPQKLELKILTKQGATRWLHLTIGRIELNGRPAGLFTGADITDLKLVEEETRQLVASDPLTGLVNHRRLLEAFVAEAKRSQRTGRSFSLMLLDLDGLRKINDQYGDLTGSRALCRMAYVLRTQCRNIDVVTRYGGDEFAVLLPETGRKGAEGLGRRICQRLSSDDQQPPLSASIGAAVFPHDGQTYEQIFNKADHALYEMRKHGGGKLFQSA
jgi:diguanylate cyclase (GGDEF)-like protein/PAS domain S-box-containing protein